MNPLMKPLVVLTAFLAIVCQSSLAAERPNVLFLAVDDMNDWIGCLGKLPGPSLPISISLPRAESILPMPTPRESFVLPVGQPFSPASSPRPPVAIKVPTTLWIILRSNPCRPALPRRDIPLSEQVNFSITRQVPSTHGTGLTSSCATQIRGKRDGP